MKKDRMLRVLLVVVAALLFLNLAYNVSTKPALAAGDIGRYQISAWAAQSGAYAHHSGYYVLDTVTGKVIDSKSEVHGPGK